MWSLTSFIGREKELAEITALLNEPSCRLLTLVGPGGIGKTRLALELLHSTDLGISNNRHYIDLQQVVSSEFITPAIADALMLSFTGSDDAFTQLVHCLNDSPILLILDNFEHVIDSSVLISEILTQAPEAKILVTSREILRLREEHTYVVEGLPVPEINVEQSSAVQLFADRARQARHDFSLDNNIDAVVRICRLVSGLPLAIELAASWVRVLDCETIAQEIEAGLDFLATDMRNVPERHRSIRAVFEQSWRMLNEDEQYALKRLTVFRGGFDLQAARYAANASLTTLTGMADKSLLRVVGARRYTMHELIRQYAEDFVRAYPEKYNSVKGTHAAYFADFVQSREPDLKSTRQVDAADDIEAEIANIRSGWEWAVETRDEALLDKYLFGLSMFSQMRSRTNQGFEMLRSADQALSDDSSLRPVLRIYEGWLQIILGSIYEGAELIMDGLATADLNENLMMPLGILSSQRTVLRERYEEVRQLYHTMLDTLPPDSWGVAWAYYGIGRTLLESEDFEEAVPYLERSITVFRSHGDLWSATWPLNFLARSSVKLNRRDDALAQYEEYRSICEATGDVIGVEHPIREIGELFLQEGNLADARHYLGKSLVIALKNTWRTILLTYSLRPIAHMIASQGEVEQAVEILSLLYHHPVVRHGYWDSEVSNIAQEIERYKEMLTPERFEEACRRGQLLDLRRAARDILETHLDGSAPTETPEDLTEREMEILQLLGVGMTNRQIADELTLAVGTVKTHIHNIFNKLNVGNRTEASVRARELQLL